MKSFSQELMINFPITIENKHVIKKDQAKISIITNGVKGCELNFAHRFRDNEEPQLDLGETISKFTCS